MRKRCRFAQTLILGLVSLLAAGAAPAKTAEEKARIDYSAAKLALSEGKPAAALAKLEKVIEVLGPVPDLLYFTAEAAFQAGEIAKARDYVAKTFKATDAPFKKSETYQKLIDLAGKIGVKEPLLDSKAKGWWTDDKGLTWTTKDNGSGGIDWHEAGSYCRLLGVGGFSDWRLPSIDELARMYDGTLPEGKPKIRSPLELSQGTWWVWSGTKDPSESSQAWALAFHTGKHYSFGFAFRREHGRVLCVRRGGE